MSDDAGTAPVTNWSAIVEGSVSSPIPVCSSSEPPQGAEAALLKDREGSVHGHSEELAAVQSLAGRGRVGRARIGQVTPQSLKVPDETRDLIRSMPLRKVGSQVRYKFGIAPGEPRLMPAWLAFYDRTMFLIHTLPEGDSRYDGKIRGAFDVAPRRNYRPRRLPPIPYGLLFVGFVDRPRPFAF